LVRHRQDRETSDLKEEVNMLDTMLSSLVDILEEKGAVTHQEWERRIKERLSSK
jgi:hypothetical protein